MVAQSPQALPEVVVPLRHLEVIDGEVCIIFLKEEIDRSSESFKFSLVLKFLHQSPMLDAIRSFI